MEAKHPGRIIDEMRTARGWTQLQLAERSGLSPQLISYLKAEGCRPRGKTVKAVASAFGCDPTEIDPAYIEPLRPKSKAPTPPAASKSRGDADELLARVGQYLQREMGFSPTPLQTVQFLIKKASLEAKIASEA